MCADENIETVTVGPLLATGRTSEVFALGDDAVVKVLRPGVPSRWAELEAFIASAVCSLGLPAPDCRGVVTVDGRAGVVFDRVRGVSMWQRILDDPSQVDWAVEALVGVQRQIHRADLPEHLPGLVPRLRTKIRAADGLSEGERDEGCAIVEALPRGAALLHGDLHPGNVLLVDDAPIVIDWFDASIGHPVADVIRSSMLLRSGSTESDAPHLPGATPELLSRLHDAYVAAFDVELAKTDDLRSSWEAVVAAGRMSEQAQRDESSLLAMWADRPSVEPGSR